MANWRDRILEEAEAARKRASHIDLDALRREEEAETGGFFAGFGLGIVVGALLALIFAPQKGNETRELVAERAIQLRDRAAGFVTQVRGEDEGSNIEPEIEREMGSSNIGGAGTAPSYNN
jgi:hypothetical protein